MDRRQSRTASRAALFGAGLAILACTGPARATLLVWEYFQYPPVPLPGLNLGGGWAGPWVGSAQMLVAPPLLVSYPAMMLPASGNTLLNPAPGECFRPFMGVGPITNTGNDIWVSWVELTSAAAGGALVSLDPSGGGFPTLFVNKDPLGNIALTCNATTTAAGSSAGPGQWDLFVVNIGQFSGGFTTVQLWVNPTAPLASLVPAAITVPGWYSMGRYYWRSDPGERLDEIRIATTWPEVVAGQESCYPNCDGSTTPPCLNVLDFSCFLNRYAAGDPYANCDSSTTPPVLNVLDFSCFLNRYAGGCSNC